MRQNKFKILFSLLLFFLAIVSFTQLDYLMPFLIGGVILQGILGGFSGKVGPIVGAAWKGIDYMRSYVIPSNPRSPAQTAHRLSFKKLVLLAREILTTVLQPFWDPFQIGMSGFNSFIKQNFTLFKVANKLTTASLVAKGTLEGTPITTCTYATATGIVSLAFASETYGNGLPTDFVIAVAYDAINQDLNISTLSAVRSSRAQVAVLRIGLLPANVIGYIFFHRGTGSDLIVSDSSGRISVAP